MSDKLTSEVSVRDFNTDKPFIHHRVNNACKSIIVLKHYEQITYYSEDYLLISQSSALKAKNCKLMTFWQVTSIKQNGLMLPTQGLNI